jgi:predicted phosphatase
LSWDHDVIKELHDEVKKISNLSDVTGVDLNPEEKVKRLNKELEEAMVELAEWQKNEATRKNS